MTMLARGEAMLDRAFGITAVRIDYLRKGEKVAEGIPAKLARTLFRAENNFGITIRTEQRDFIVRYQDLPLCPVIGDEVHFDGRVYLVTAPNNEPCWRWHTHQTHTQMRIHAKEAGEVE